jgi:hypothetical protein
MKIFISYRRVDRVRAEEIASVLRAIDHEPRWDDRLELGGDWQRELEQRISDCDAFLYLASRDSMESEWCQWELNLAVLQGKPLLPIIIREGAPLPTCLEHVHALHAPKKLDIRQATLLRAGSRAA